MKDRTTFDRMFNEWYAQFVYFAYYFISDVEVCKDIVSDAFEYLWRNYDKIEEATAKLIFIQLSARVVSTISVNKIFMKNMWNLLHD